MHGQHQPRQYKDGTRYWEKGHRFPVSFTIGATDEVPEPAPEPDLPRFTIRFGVAQGECRLLVLDGETELDRVVMPVDNDWHGLLEAMRTAARLREEQGPAVFVVQSKCEAVSVIARYCKKVAELKQQAFLRAEKSNSRAMRAYRILDPVMNRVLRDEAMVAVVCEIWRHIYTVWNVEFEEGWK